MINAKRKSRGQAPTGPGLRQRQALATRHDILDAARALFLESGYVAATIEAIARRAGVGVSTVYAVHGSKIAILRELRELWHADSGIRDILERAAGLPTGEARLELFAQGTRRQWSSRLAIPAIYRQAAAADAEAAAELKKSLAGRRAALEGFLRGMSALARQDMGFEDAAAILRTLSRYELYEELVMESGWSPDKYEHWLAEVLKKQLLPAPPAKKTRRHRT